MIRALRLTLLLAAVAAGAALLPAGAAATTSNGVTISTSYPAVAVEPGKLTRFQLTVSSVVEFHQRIDLAIIEAPEGWPVVIRGGANVIDGVMVAGDEAPAVNVDVDVPLSAAEGDYRVVVQATALGGSVALPLDLRVAEAVGGNVTLTTDFEILRGRADATFRFDLALQNDTPEDVTFSLAALAPPGWSTTARPSAEILASTITVLSGESGSVVVETDPPDGVEAGFYPLAVRAAGGGAEAVAQLGVEITGTFSIALIKPDERLNTSVRAGRTTDVPLTVVNNGTAVLTDLTMRSGAPANWEVTFTPAEVAEVAPSQVISVVAAITPSGDAIAGDYSVSLEARAREARDGLDLRATVKTARVWGLVGVGLIAAAIVGLAVVFRLYGRR